MSVAVNPPKTPVTKGSNGIATATIPNICKMPGPPAPFVPTPLPNIGKSDKSPKGYSKKVKIESNPVAIKGASFNSMGDIASKGTGGGLVSSNTEGPTKFVGPGSLDVKIEGKNVQLLSDPMLNNCGPSGSPPNAATLQGLLQKTGLIAIVGDEPCVICGKEHGEDKQLKESGKTKEAAKKLRRKAEEAVKQAKRKESAVMAMKERRGGAPEKVKIKLETMLGVVHCEDKKIYAGKSSFQVKELQDQIKEKDWHTPVAKGSIAFGKPKGQHDPLSRFLKHFPTQGKKFEEGWQKAKEAHRNYKKDKKAGVESEPFHLPGECAAQQLVVLSLDHEAIPVELTEIYYSSEDSKKKVPAAVRRKKKGKPTIEKFGGNDAVPPCGSCQIILTMLMCPQEERVSSWRPPEKKGICKCNP
jgi:hypothetical protein